MPHERRQLCDGAGATVRRLTRRWAAGILCAAWVAAWCAVATAQTVWDGVDPERPALDVKILRTETVDGVGVQVLRYTSLVWEGKPVRVLGMYGRPKGPGPFPAILHFHGKGGRASPEDIAHFVKRGYACFSFDWTGPNKGRTDFTVWPEGLTTRYAPDKTSHMYHTLVAARRAITFLCGRPEVDKERIGEYGISYGGYFTWILNATEPRLKVCVPIYGCGGVLEEGHTSRHHLPEIAECFEPWARSYEPLRLAARQRAPVLYIGSTNDFFGWSSVAERALAACPAPKRRIYSLGTNHNVSPEAARTAHAWLDHYLKGGPALPASPALEITVGPDGVLRGLVKPDAVERLDAVRVDYSLGDAPSPGRCWRSVTATRTGDVWSAALEVADADAPLQAMAYAAYCDGVALHGAMVRLRPSEAGPARATLKPATVIDDYSQGISGWTATHAVGIFGAWQRLAIEPNGFNGRPCLKVEPLGDSLRRFNVLCWRPADPQWNGRGAKGLTLWIKGAKGSLRLEAVARYGRIGSRGTRADVPLKEAPGWQKITVPTDQFTTRGARKPLAGWDEIEVIQISGKPKGAEPVMIGPVAWVGR